MAIRDLFNNIHPVPLFSPIAAQTNSDTARVSAIIDTRGYESVTFVLQNGTNTDANVTFAVLVEDGDDATLVADGAAVVDAYLLGTEALAASAFGDDIECRKIGYVGPKRYVRVTVTPTGNNSGDWFMSGVAILGHPALVPTANPPS